MATPLSELISQRLSRRDVLKGALACGALTALSTPFSPLLAARKDASLPMHISDTLEVLPGYRAEILLSWGEPLVGDQPPVALTQMTADAQEKCFGTHCDYIAFIPMGHKNRGLLCVNHEYTDAAVMFASYGGLATKTRAQAEVELAAHGHSVVEIERGAEGRWQKVAASPYHRRITARSTYFRLTGPAAGHKRLATTEDPRAMSVLGTLGNCAGGKTPWGTVLIAEENFNDYFYGQWQGQAEERNYARYGLGQEDSMGWWRFFDRFDLAKEPNEANRFGWVVELDPFNPESQPVKHTALGRFKHESATVTLAPDGRLVVYSGDDEADEFLYRYVSHGRFDKNVGKSNGQLLMFGTLYVAQFDESGLRWLPLTWGVGPLTQANGFHSQADVLIEARTAATLMGATPMDRPEDIEVHPNGTVFVSLTNNRHRDIVNIVNPRVRNVHGHILALTPPKADHAAEQFSWEIVLKGGDPARPEQQAAYPVADAACWLSCPDNLALHPVTQELWIATDGQPKTAATSDSVYRLGADGRLQRMLNVPRGAEATGPEFSPDGRTLFLSVQHPERWPNRNSALPAASCVIALTRADGGVV